MPRECNYSTGEREALAAVWGCEYFEKFLLGRKFTLRTDHSALQQLLTNPGRDLRKSSKFIRWAERLSIFDYTPVYRRGSENTVADALSRLPAPTIGPTIDDPGDQVILKRLSAEGLPLSEFISATAADPLFQQIINFVQSDWPNKNKISPELRPYFSIRGELSVESACLIRENDRLAVPASLRKQLLQLAHSGHPRIVRMKRQLRTSFWWPGMDTDCEHMVRHCHACQSSAKSAPPSEVPTTTRIEQPSEPWKRTGLDIAGPFDVAPTSKRYIVTLIDHHSQFP